MFLSACCRCQMPMTTHQKYDWSNVGNNRVARAVRIHNMSLPQYLRTTRTCSSKCFAYIPQHCWVEIIVEYLQLLKDSLSLRLPLYFFFHYQSVLFWNLTLGECIQCMRRRVLRRVALALGIRIGLLRVFLIEKRVFFCARSAFKLVLNLLNLIS